MRLLLFLLALFPLCFLQIYSMHMNYPNGYFYFHESGKYLVNYLEDKPLVKKLFDYRANDAEYYRPRELGNVFNLIDAYLVLLTFKIGLPNFFSPVHYFMMLTIAVSPLVFVITKKKLSYIQIVIAVLLGLLFLSSPAPFFTINYFRTSKSAVGFLAAIFFWLVYSLHNQKNTARRFLYYLGIFLLSFSLGITDETGIIISLLFCGYLFTRVLCNVRSSVIRYSFISSVIGIGAIGFYRKVISPLITASVIGTYPTEWGGVTLSGNYREIIQNGSTVLFHYVSALTNMLPLFVVVLLVGVIGFIVSLSFVESFILRDSLFTHKKIIVAVMSTIEFFLITVGGVSLLLGLMISVVPTVLTEETLQFIYYPLPFVTIWFLLIVSAVFYVLYRYKNSQYIFVALLPILIVLNLFSLSTYYSTLKTNWRTKQYYNAGFPLMKAITASTIRRSELHRIDGAEIIPVFRNKMGKSPIKEE